MNRGDHLASSMLFSALGVASLLFIPRPASLWIALPFAYLGGVALYKAWRKDKL